MSEEYTSEIIENTRRQMKSIGYENVKEGMLDSVALTGSWIQLDDLKEIMPENEYQELLKEIEMRVRTRYTTGKYPKISAEKLEEIIQDEIKSIDFVIANDGNNGHNIEEFFAIGKDKIIKAINVKDMDGVKLAQTIAKVMQRHLDYGTFHANQYYSAEEMERALKYDIDRLKREEVVFEQDRDKGEAEKEDNSSSKVKIGDMKKSATPAEKTYLGNIENAVAYLQECKRKGQNVYIEFNGNILYSCDVTLDSAYLQITGLTKEESDKVQEELSGTTTIKDGKFYTDEEKEKAIVEKYKKIEQGHIEEAKKSATPAEKTYLGNIENAVAYLQECKRKGKNVYVDFNGHKLYSSDVTIDSAYMEVVGMTKAEDNAIREEYRQAKTDKEREAIIEKWNSIRKAHAEAGDEKGSKTVLDSAIEATEEKTKTSVIKGQVQGIKGVSKETDEKVEGTEIVE